jgi:hypothetical protein
MDLNTFLAPVVEGVCLLKSLKNNSGVYKTTDPEILEVAKDVLSAFQEHCNREFVLDNYKEIIQPRYDEIFLKETPIIAITGCVELLTDTIVTSTDYTLQNGYGNRNDFLLIINKNENMKWKVSYVGGYALASDNTQLFTALKLQTLAWYNVKQKIGLSSYSGEHGVSENINSKLPFLERVEKILNKFITE